ncbi:murein L,D-transpeptidase family protein [Leptospira sp. WS39.C2]
MKRSLDYIKNIFVIVCISFFGSLHSETNTIVYVKKSEKTLTVTKAGKTILKIPISLGFEPEGPKKEEGDGKTPEGTYTIDYQIPEWDYYKALHISYPNKTQLEEAKKRNVKAGSGILIHGMKRHWNWFGHLHTYLNWTHGCMAVTNEEMDLLFEMVPVGSKIRIEP